MDAALIVDHYTVFSTGATPVPHGVVVRVLVHLSGKAPADRNRAPLGLSLLIDRSGSMCGERIEAARTAAARAVERLHPDDVVSVIAFDDAVDVVAPPAPRGRQRSLVSRIMAIETRGSTNLSGGWLRARQHLEQAIGMMQETAGASRRIVILTDGHANVGIVEPNTLVELARTARAMGITTSTIGVGEGYDDDLLRAMADAGGGNAWYIERPDQAGDVLGEELGNLLSLSAQGVQVSLSLVPGIELLTVHSDWPSVPTTGVSMQLDVGDLYANEPKPVLLELFVPAAIVAEHATAVEVSPIATIRIVADVLADGGVEHREVVLPVGASLAEHGCMVPAVEHAVLLARTAKARDDATQRQRAGDDAGAQQLMEDAARALSDSPLSRDGLHADELQAQVSDLTRLAQQYASGHISEADHKYQRQRSYNAKRGKKRHDDQLDRGNDAAQEP